jgi:large subunit ribosomal protein L11
MAEKTSELIKKAVGIQKGGSDQKKPVGDLSLDEVIEIAKQKMKDLMSKDLKAAVKEVLGTMLSMGITCEGKNPKEIIKEIDEGKYDDKF